MADTPLEEEAKSLQRQLDEARENLRLIQERKVKYVLSTDIPLQLEKEEGGWPNKIAELEQQLRAVEQQLVAKRAEGGVKNESDPLQDPKVEPPPAKPPFDSPRGQVLWRLAYAFLRLDQLPSGGWGKTLYTWMEMIWEGDRGTIVRSPDTRFKGGTDFTLYAFYQYYLFLEKVLPLNQVAGFLDKNETANRVYGNFKGRIGYQGAIGARRSFRSGGAPDVRVRHTLMGFIMFLLYAKANQYALNIQDSLDPVHHYLVENISKWEHDESHLFGMAGAAVKLQEMLLQQDIKDQLTSEQIEQLKAVLDESIPKMMKAAITPPDYDPLPPHTIHGPLQGTIFRPYGSFWRMERSSFLMNFPLLVTDDGKRFLPGVSHGVKRRCRQIFCELLNDITPPYDSGALLKHLIRYHRNSRDAAGNETEAPRDWGLSAELAALLQTEAVRELLIQSGAMEAGEYDEKRSALNQALLETFDGYHEHPEIFKFTHGASFGRVLHLFEKGLVKPKELEKLDAAISRLCAEGVTELGLTALVKDYIGSAAEESSGIKLRALRDLLITKLESGEHTPDPHICVESQWKQKVQVATNEATIAFYESDLSDEHIKRYVATPRLNLTYEIQYLFKQMGKTKTKGVALDVGCGAGQYAKLLAKMGFEVRLLDASRKMLKVACTQLGLAPNAFVPVNIFDAAWGYPDAAFDLIFASAIMIHVPEEKRDHVYSMFHRLLKPDGVLFVNYKIGDHSLISDNGRFFAYYRDDSQPRSELEDSGFQVRVEILDANYTDMYQMPRLIQWAHFCCTKK